MFFHTESEGGAPKWKADCGHHEIMKADSLAHKVRWLGLVRHIQPREGREAIQEKKISLPSFFLTNYLLHDRLQKRTASERPST